MNEQVRLFLDHYLYLLQTRLPAGMVEDCLLYGSIALEAYEEGRSDIDFLTVLSKELTPGETDVITKIHNELLEHPLGSKLDGMYLKTADLGRQNSDLAPYLYCREGVIAKGHWDINAVTWFVLKTRGISLIGNKELHYEIEWKDIHNEMHYNINRYWNRKLAKPYLFLSDEWVEFTVSTLARILITLEEQRIVSKKEGIHRAAELVNPRWMSLLEEAANPQMNKRRTSRILRAFNTRSFLKETIEFCNERYFSERK
jgi:hypothetical protein